MCVGFYRAKPLMNISTTEPQCFEPVFRALCFSPTIVIGWWLQPPPLGSITLRGSNASNKELKPGSNSPHRQKLSDRRVCLLRCEPLPESADSSRTHACADREGIGDVVSGLSRSAILKKHNNMVICSRKMVPSSVGPMKDVNHLLI